MRIVVTDPIHEAGLNRLKRAGFAVEQASEFTAEARADAIRQAEALVVRSGTEITATVLESAPYLEIIARAGIGVDNIDLDAANDHGVLVVNAPTGGVDAVVEHTMALAYAMARELPWTDRMTRRGDWPKASYNGSELAAMTLGIIGLGRIGRSVSRSAERLGVDTVGYDPYVDQTDLDDLSIERLDLHSCARRADIVTVHVPLTSETDRLIDASFLANLEGGYLINCSRGGVVDEAALVDALEDETLAGAAVDVFDAEPVEADHPLATHERTLLTPHVAGTSDRAQRVIAESVADQLIAFDSGEPVDHPVNEPS